MSNDQEFLDEEGNANPEVAGQLLNSALFGDSQPSVDTSNEPSVAQPEDNAKPESAKAGEPEANNEPKADNANQAQAPDEGELNNDNAVIQAKDGIHTISYDSLVEARRRAQEYKQQVEQLAESQRVLEQQLAEANARAQTGQAPTVQDQQAQIAQQAINQGVDASIFGDFSEEALANGIETLINQRVGTLVEQRVSLALAPLHQQQQVSAEQAHFDAILAKHPSAFAIAESNQFQQWKENQPSFMRDAYDQVLKVGTANQIIELLDLYQGSHNPTTPAAATQDVKAAALKAVNQAPTKVPQSLTDLPSGATTGLDTDERLSNLDDGADLFSQLQTMTPEQVDAFLARTR